MLIMSTHCYSPPVFPSTPPFLPNSTAMPMASGHLPKQLSRHLLGIFAN